MPSESAAVPALVAQAPPFPPDVASAHHALVGPVLAIDTSDGVCVALTSGTAGQSISLNHPSPREHAEQLAPLVRAALDQAGLTARDLAGIAVGTGPAPFTGLRIGLMTARALGHAARVPVWGVCSLDVLGWSAHLAAVTTPVEDPWESPVERASSDSQSLDMEPSDTAKAEREGERDIVTVGDARRREVYVAHYRSTPAHLERSADPAVMAPGDLMSALGDGVCVVGRTDLLGLATPTVHADAVLLALLGAWRASVGADTDASPLYLRRPDVHVATSRKRATV